MKMSHGPRAIKFFVLLVLACSATAQLYADQVRYWVSELYKKVPVPSNAVVLLVDGFPLDVGYVLVPTILPKGEYRVIYNKIDRNVFELTLKDLVIVINLALKIELDQTYRLGENEALLLLGSTPTLVFEE